MTTLQAPVRSRVSAVQGQPPAPVDRPADGRALLVWTAVISALVVLSSVAGLLDPRVYAQETENWALQGQGQDVGNLLAVVVLVGSAVRHARRSGRAARVWLGTLLYLVYAFVVYAMAVHLNYLFFVYVAVLGLSAWAVLLHAGDLRRAAAPVRQRSVGGPAVVLVATGVLFAGLWLGELVPALLAAEVPASIVEAGLWVNPIHVIDLSVVLPAFVLSGVAALRGREAGLFWLAPWLVFSVLMGSSIVAAMVLMMLGGESAALVPAVMVAVLVVASLVATWELLRSPRIPTKGSIGA